MKSWSLSAFEPPLGGNVAYAMAAFLKSSYLPELEQRHREIFSYPHGIQPSLLLIRDETVLFRWSSCKASLGNRKGAFGRPVIADVWRDVEGKLLHLEMGGEMEEADPTQPDTDGQAKTKPQTTWLCDFVKSQGGGATRARALHVLHQAPTSPQPSRIPNSDERWWW
jgi:hypothetical protein